MSTGRKEGAQTGSFTPSSSLMARSACGLVWREPRGSGRGGGRVATSRDGRPVTPPGTVAATVSEAPGPCYPLCRDPTPEAALSVDNGPHLGCHQANP